MDLRRCTGDPTIAGYYVELVVMAHLCVASLVATCFFVIMANTAEAFGFLLRTLPVSRRVINVSADAPVLFVSVAIALSSTPAFAYVVATAVGPLAALASTGALIALAIGSSMACVAVVRAAVGVVSRVRAVRREAGEALGMLLPVAGAMALFYYAVVYPHDNPVRRLSSSYAAGLVRRRVAGFCGHGCAAHTGGAGLDRDHPAAPKADRSAQSFAARAAAYQGRQWDNSAAVRQEPGEAGDHPAAA